MNSGVTVAVFVSVLGFFIILSATFLLYKWRASTLRRSSPVIDQEVGTPPMQQYRIRQGRMVPKDRTQSVISARSGWQTLRHATIVFNTPKTAVKVDNNSIKTVDVKGHNRRYPSMGSVMSVPPTPELPPDPNWRSKLLQIRTQAVPETHPPSNQSRPQLSVTVPAFPRESWRSMKSPQTPRRWPQETIQEVETPPPSERSDPFDTPRESRKSSNASSHPETFLHLPIRDSMPKQTPQFPKPTYTVFPPQPRGSMRSIAELPA